jgi:BirA family transcriptional regulator, biotin operon repressor / biotin---[acetyl-CoA-carboxylase] ligase
LSVYTLHLPGLKTRALGRNCFHFSTVESTQDILRNLFHQGAAEGTTVLADEQSKGRGRAGKSWSSIPGGQIQVSVLLSPTFPLTYFPLVNVATGITICEALEEYGVREVQIKWPNDVYVSGRKIAGTIAEFHQEAKGGALLLGIGINVEGKNEALPPEIHDTAITVEMVRPSPDRFELLGMIFNHLEAQLDDLHTGLEQETVHIQSEFQRRWIYRGKEISVNTGQVVLKGTSEKIDSDGALLLKARDGSVQRVLSGDVVQVRVNS